MDDNSVVVFLKNNKNSWQTQKSLKALLADCIPEEKALRRVMEYIYEVGIVKEWDNATDKNRLAYKYKRVLCDSYAIEESIADRCIGIWMKVLGEPESAISNASETLCDGIRNSVKEWFNDECIEDEYGIKLDSAKKALLRGIAFAEKARDYGSISKQEGAKRLIRIIEEEIQVND